MVVVFRQFDQAVRERAQPGVVEQVGAVLQPRVVEPFDDGLAQVVALVLVVPEPDQEDAPARDSATQPPGSHRDPVTNRGKSSDR